MGEYDKLSPDIVSLLDAKSVAQVASINAFISLETALQPEQERLLTNLGVTIRTLAGDVVTCDIPISVVHKVADLSFIRFIEKSRSLSTEK